MYKFWFYGYRLVKNNKRFQNPIINFQIINPVMINFEFKLEKTDEKIKRLI